MEITSIVRASTRDLGERLLALHEECGRQDWSVVGHPEAAAIIAELRRRDTGQARDALEAVGLEVPGDDGEARGA